MQSKFRKVQRPKKISRSTLIKTQVRSRKEEETKGIKVSLRKEKIRTTKGNQSISTNKISHHSLIKKLRKEVG